MAHQTSHPTVDPFADPVFPVVTERDLILESTLAVGKNASLTLGRDAIIVLDDEHRDRPRTVCGVQIFTGSASTRSIPYYNVLSASVTKNDLTIRYAKPASKSAKARVFVQTLIYHLSSPFELAEKWVKRLLDRSYGPAQRNKRIKVLVNPYGGAGRAAKRYTQYVAPIFEAANCTVEVETTKHQGHAIEIAENMDIDAYDVLACASGDGLPMESFNGLARKPNASEALRKIAVVQIPCGTGNAMSWNLNGTGEPSLAALCIVKGVRTPLDLAAITQASSPNTRTLSFLSQAIGIVAQLDLGTDNMRWMGDARFTVGFLLRIFGKTVYPIDIAVKTEIEDKTAIKQHYAREVAKRRRLDLGSHEILDKDLESSTALGLPPLKHGTISDPLPTTKISSTTSESTTAAAGGWSPLMHYSNLGNFYCGNMCIMTADAPFFAASLPNDGLLDLITIDGDISRMKAVSLLLRVESGEFFDEECVRYRKISCVRVIPRFGQGSAEKHSESSDDHQISKTTKKKQGMFSRMLNKMIGSSEKEAYFAVDGEKMPFEPFQVEVHRGLGTVLSRRWGTYEYDAGPKGWQQYSTDVGTDESTT